MHSHLKQCSPTAHTIFTHSLNRNMVHNIVYSLPKQRSLTCSLFTQCLHIVHQNINHNAHYIFSYYSPLGQTVFTLLLHIVRSLLTHYSSQMHHTIDNSLHSSSPKRYTHRLHYTIHTTYTILNY